MGKELVCVKIIVKGRVQGIGYRWFVREIAEQENIYGYVKNNYDGSVEIVAESYQKTNIDRFIQRIKTEHEYAVVKDVKIENLTPLNYKEFKILF
jgi:acylphosphatase